MTYYVVKEGSAIWIDGVKKRKLPSWTAKLPVGDFRGYVLVESDGSIVWEQDHANG